MLTKEREKDAQYSGNTHAIEALAQDDEAAK
jgi:hypothetical protein